MRFATEEGAALLSAATSAAHELAFALDFDGTLAPIVENPEAARIHPGAAQALEGIARNCGAVALITGRPVRQLLDLSGLAGFGRRLDRQGLRLEVFGQYGAERWSSAQPEVRAPDPAPGLGELARELPSLLRQAGVPQARIEDKGLALAVHTRELPDPELSLAILRPSLREAAIRHGLDVEPGRMVLEIRSPGPDKGESLAMLLAETGTRGAVFIGDDRGDLPAFAEVLLRREQGQPGLRVLSGATENAALQGAVDVVVDGVDGVVEFLTLFAARAHRG